MKTRVGVEFVTTVYIELDTEETDKSILFSLAQNAWDSGEVKSEEMTFNVLSFEEVEETTQKEEN